MNSYSNKWILTGTLIVIFLSVVNARGEFFQDNFDRPDGEVGNGWEIWRGGNLDIKIEDNEVLIAGQQRGSWKRSGIYRLTEGETRFSFDFKADDNLTVHIELWDYETDICANFYAWPGGPFCYYINGNVQIPGSPRITNQYNNLVVEKDGTDITLTLNGQVIGTVTEEEYPAIANVIHIDEVFIFTDATHGTVGSIHIDNVVIGQPPTITNYDLNGDGTVDVNDVVTLTDYWGRENSVCDICPNGIIDTKDLLALASYLEQETALIVHWPMDETEGMLAIDSVGNGSNDAVVVGGATWQFDGGQIDGALELDGVSGCVIASENLNPADGPFSIFAWVKGGAPGQVIVSQQAASDWLLLDSEGNLMTELKSSDQLADPLISETVITDGQWHRIGLVWDGSTRILCVDGFKVAEDTQPGLESSANSLYIGVGKDYAAGTYFSGLIDDVRIYNRAVSP